MAREGVRCACSGQYTDAETGLIYLRARYYDPATAQFLSRDPLTAMTGAPYSYAADNPLNNTDPTGLDANTGGPGPPSIGYLAEQNDGQASCPFPIGDDPAERFIVRLFPDLWTLGKLARALPESLGEFVDKLYFVPSDLLRDPLRILHPQRHNNLV
ncbi:MAG: hypothetical protein NVS3B12_28620 [Acidimicrobiales bacterium]